LVSGGVGERLARWIVENDVSWRLNEGQPRGVLRGAVHRLLDPLRRRIARRIRSEIVGPQFDYFISGGAKLPVETAAFLFAIGMPIYEGYGSTETNCPIATSTPWHNRLGSVGKLYADIDAKIDPATGELLVKGPNIALGYWNGDDQSLAHWDADGWYHTRDVATLDDDGYLQIEGRLDHMLVLLNGENVSPIAIENRCAAIAGVESAIVVGDHREALVALVALSEQAVRQLAASREWQLSTPWQEDRRIVEWLRGEIQRHVNDRAGHPYECIRHVAIIDSPSVREQTLTATEKIRRREIQRRYASLIEQLYADSPHWLTPGGAAPTSLRRVAAL
jgi:long-chain acyl-CoA synthetase